jgi:cobalt-precorrin 5A hydrolase
MAHHQALSAPPIAIGIGCRSGASAANIVSLVQRTLGDARLDSANAKLFTIDTKRDEMGLIKAARLLALPIAFLAPDALAARAADAVTRSQRIEALYNVPSIAETAALAGAGPGSRLVVPRIAAGAVTCAVALASGEKEKLFRREKTEELSRPAERFRTLDRRASGPSNLRRARVIRPAG